MAITLGDRLRTVRVERGISQTDLARDIVSASYVSLIETDKRVPERAVLEQLAARLDVTVSFLESGFDETDVEDRQLAIRYAELALANGQLDEAYTRFQELVPSSPPAIRSHAVWGIARILETRGDLAGAITAVESLIEEAREDRAHIPSLLVLLNNRCWLYREAGDLNHSIELGEAAVADARALGLAGTEEEIRLATTLVGCYWDRGDLTRAHLLVQEVIKRAESLGSHRAKGSVYWNASLVAEGRGQRHLAIHLAERAVALLGEHGDDFSLAQIRIVLAWLLLRTSPPNIAQAEEILLRSHEVMSVLNIERELSECEMELATVRLMQGNPVAAADYAIRVIDRSRSADEPALARATVIYGQALFAGGDVKGGREQLAKSMDLINSVKRRRTKAQLLREAGDVFASIGMLAESVNAFQQLAECVGTRPTPTLDVLSHRSTSNFA